MGNKQALDKAIKFFADGVWVANDDVENHTDKLNPAGIQAKTAILRDSNHAEYQNTVKYLEETHDYIQWLFPTTKASANNKNAPAGIDAADVAALDPAQTQTAQQALQRHFELMLAFYGMEYNQASKIVGSISNAAIAARFTPNNPATWNHNLLRLTRMVKSLRLFGLNDQANALITTLNQLAADKKYNIPDDTKKIWTELAAPQPPKKKGILDDDEDDDNTAGPQPIFSDTTTKKTNKPFDEAAYQKAKRIAAVTAAIATSAGDASAQQALIQQRNQLLSEHLQAKLVKGKKLSKEETLAQAAVQSNPVVEDATVKVTVSDIIARQKNKEVKFALQKSKDPTFKASDAEIQKAVDAKNKGEHVVVMTLITDHQKGNKPAMDLIKIYEDPDTPELFKTHHDLKKAVDDAMKAVPLKINNVDYTVFGKVVNRGTEDERVDFWKRDAAGKESVISQTDIDQYRKESGANASLTKFVMDSASAYVSKNMPKTYVHTQVRETDDSKTKYKFK